MSNISFSILLSNKSITEGSRNYTVWQILFGVFLVAFLVAVFFVFLPILLRRNVKACYQSTTQTSVNNLELVNGHNSKGDYAQSEDSADEAQTDDTGVVGADAL